MLVRDRVKGIFDSVRTVSSVKSSLRLAVMCLLGPHTRTAIVVIASGHQTATTPTRRPLPKRDTIERPYGGTVADGANAGRPRAAIPVKEYCCHHENLGVEHALQVEHVEGENGGAPYKSASSPK